MSTGIAGLKLMSSAIGRTVVAFVTRAFNKKYLLYTNVAISTGLSGLGDAIEQRYEIWTGDLSKYNARRTAHMSVSGVTVGALCHYYYRILDKYFPGQALRIVVRKIVIDQFVCSPCVIATFFATLAVLEGNTFQEFVDECKEKAWRLYVAEWLIWPPAQFINFYFLPGRYRVLYDSGISLIYDIYTSHVKFDKKVYDTDQTKEDSE